MAQLSRFHSKERQIFSLRIKLKLISQPPQDSDSNSQFILEQTTNRPSRKTHITRFTAFVLASSIVIGIPAFAQAGILSMMSSVFGANEEVASATKPLNIQKMDLLEAATNSDPVPPLEGGSENIVNGSALSTETASGSSGEANGVFKQNSDHISLYTVRKGDTLQQIADMYDVSANTILWANDLKRGSTVSPGQVLVILPVSGVKYIAKKGDTIDSVAKKFKADVSDIAEYNNLSSGEKLAVGDELIIPDGVLAHEGETVTSSGSTPAVKKSSTLLGSSLLSPIVTNREDTSGYFTRPVIGGVRTQGLHGHNGIDMAASLGTPIHAAAAGTVIIAKAGGWNGGYGTYVVIQHSNGMQTLYGHMSALNVSAGEAVSKGEMIGKMGNTGDSTGVHLHFEVRGGVNPF